jgi:drug/metabolite transporter (DMT)-like permease
LRVGSAASCRYAAGAWRGTSLLRRTLKRTHGGHVRRTKQTRLDLASLGPSPIPSTISVTAVWALLAVSSLATVLPFYLFFYVIEARGAQVAVLVNYLIPLFGVLWGALLLKEQPTLTHACGLAIIFVGVWLLVREPLRDPDHRRRPAA